MLDQLDQMQVSTLVHSIPVPCSQQQERMGDLTHALLSPPVYSYAIGPLDATQVTTLQAHLSTDEDVSLLVPTHLSPSILTHSWFKDGYECGYTESDPEEEYSVPKLVNEVYHILVELCYEDEANFCPWTLGFLLGELASLAERDRTLAFTGLAHVCFLLPLLTQGRPPCWPRYEPYHAGLLHHRAVRAYRARVRAYREQGVCFWEAQHLALAVPAQ